MAGSKVEANRLAKRAKTGGRRKGTPNLLTGEIKTLVMGAMRDLGGKRWLVQQARKNPAAFMVLFGKLIPHEVTGAGGGPIRIVAQPEDVGIL